MMTIAFYLAAGLVVAVAAIVYALLAPDTPPETPSADAVERARLDLIAQLGRSPSVIRPRERNGLR